MNFYYRDMRSGAPDSVREDAALARLRTDQLLRAVRVAHGFSAAAQEEARRGTAMTGELLGADDVAGTDARVIESGAAGWSDLGAAVKRRQRRGAR